MSVNNRYLARNKVQNLSLLLITKIPKKCTIMGKNSCIVCYTWVVITLIAVAHTAKAQSVNPQTVGREICKTIQADLVRGYISTEKAEGIVDQILAPLGLPRNFVMIPCPNIQNALAIIYDQIRYVLYDDKLLEALDTRSGTSYASISVLAHEVGHHLSGHTLIYNNNKEQQRADELEADEFSGFVMRKLGATLSEAQAAMRIIGDERDDRSSSHPNKAKRLEAILRGYNKSSNKTLVSIAEKKQSVSVEQYINEGNEFFKKGEYDNAIESYSKALSFKPNASYIFFNRGMSYFKSGRYKKSVIDLQFTVQISPHNSEFLYSLGFVRIYNQDYETALQDLKEVIRMENDHPYAYHAIGKSYYELGKYNEAKENFALARRYGGEDFRPIWADEELNTERKIQSAIDKEKRKERREKVRQKSLQVIGVVLGLIVYVVRNGGI